MYKNSVNLLALRKLSIMALLSMYRPPNIGFISATEIRNKIDKGDSSWKDNVDFKIHAKVLKYLNK
jgi:hypothetical protein